MYVEHSVLDFMFNRHVLLIAIVKELSAVKHNQRAV